MSHEGFANLRPQILLAAARGITSHLEGWSLREPTHDWGGCLVSLDGPADEGLELVWLPNCPRGRVKGVLPEQASRTPAWVSEQDRKRLSIGVDFKRPADALARDIARRLLPAYAQILAVVRSRIDRSATSSRAAEELLDELSSRCPVLARTDSQRRRHEVTLAEGLGSIRTTEPTETCPPTAELRLRLPGPTAAALLRLLKESFPS